MIFRRRLQNKFTAISNAICVDTGMSTDARWCLWYLLTKPEDWIVRPKDIQAVSGWGKDKAYRVIGELVSAKYFVVSQTRDEGGQFGPISYDVYDEPHLDLPFPENPDAVYPVTENKEHTKDLQVPRTEEIQSTDSNILVDADFEAFWAAYPKRPGNPKKPAKLKYTAARKRGVSHETIMAGVNAYAQTRANEDPKFTKLAETWLNKECWETDCSPPDDKPALDTEAGGKWLDELLAVYPGHVGDRADAAKLIAVEMSRGVNGKDLWDAARKYKLWCAGPPYENRKTVPAMLETWLKFKWREMEGYEFCQVGPDRINTVRPKKVKQ